MFELKSGSRAGVQVFFIMLCFLSLQKARDPRDPGVLYLRAQSAYRTGIQHKEIASLQKAKSGFDQLTRQAPRYGKGWLGLALTRLAMAENSGHLTRAEWDQEARPLLEKAYREEPGSAWMNYNTARALLSHETFLDEAEKNFAVLRMHKSVLLHDPGQVSPYLRPALAFLWGRFQDFELLKKITPPDIYSYEVLLAFMEEKNLWQYRDKIETDYLSWNDAVYQKQCRRAERFLKQGEYARAFQEFQKAFWRKNISMPARAGMLAAQTAAGGMPKNFKQALRSILEQSEEPEAYAYLPFMEKAVSQLNDPYLSELFAERLKGQGPVRKGPAAEKITKNLPASAWWKSGSCRWRVQVDLKPGPVIFHLKLQSNLVRGVGAYVQADLWEGERVRHLGHFYLKNEAWQTAKFSVQTSGGKRWLEIAQLNAGPLLQMGDINVEYLS